jgi:ribosomal protein S18 acetylase RimI-like enzyme
MLAQGFKSCSLWVFPQNDRAIKFYRATGFTHDGSTPKPFELGGAQLQEVRFVAQLDA